MGVITLDVVDKRGSGRTVAESSGIVGKTHCGLTLEPP